MRISIFGLGYVGAVSAACLADMGHQVIGVDVAKTNVSIINSGLSPIVEHGLAELIVQHATSLRLRATENATEAVLASDISIICVGTPSQSDGNNDCSHLKKVCAEIGAALKKKKDFHVVVVRSTIIPGAMRESVIPALEQASGKKSGVDFGVCNNPEFLREGSAIHDFRNPSRTVIGATDARSGDMVQKMYEGLPGDIIRCEIEVGEMVKYADNAWHAAKITFANEIGALCKSSGIDSHKVMDIFCQDMKLNISPAYLKPGFAFGGSCLPKDLRALNYKAQSAGVKIPLLNSLLPSNDEQIKTGIDVILTTGKKSVGFLGLSFKAGTDDLRESPLVMIAEHLLKLGLDVRMYDSNIHPSRLAGVNRDYILNAIPEIERLMINSMEKLLAASEVIVIGNNAPEFATIARKLRPEHVVVDFVRIKEIEESHNNYHGICW